MMQYYLWKEKRRSLPGHARKYMYYRTINKVGYLPYNSSEGQWKTDMETTARGELLSVGIFLTK